MSRAFAASSSASRSPAQYSSVPNFSSLPRPMRGKPWTVERAILPDDSGCIAPHDRAGGSCSPGHGQMLVHPAARWHLRSWMAIHHERPRDPARGRRSNRPDRRGATAGTDGGDLPAVPQRDFLAAVHERVVVFDGGMGATLEQFDLGPEDYGGLEGKCHEALVLHRPDVIEGVHASMLDAGAEVGETDTFQASRLKLEEWGLGEHTLEINTKAAQIARKAAGDDRFVAGSIGPTGHLPASDDPTLGKITFRELVEVFTEQARGLVEGGADLLIIETAQDILEVKAAVFGAREAFKATGRAVPIQTSVSLLPQGGKMLLGTDIRAVLTTLSALDVQAIGLNCSTGPEDMRDAIRFLGESSPVPVHCIPNAGLPLQGPEGETIFPEEPEPLANALQEFVERYGVSIVGGCCGTTPDHIGAIVERVGGREAGPRPDT